MRRFASQEARGQRGIRELAKIAEYANMGFRDEIGMLPARNRPQNAKKWSWNREKPTLGASGSQNGPKWGGEGTAKIAKIAKNGRKPTNLASGANGGGVGRADARRARGGPKVPFACICVHLRSIFGLKTAIWTANGRKWGGLEGPKTVIFSRKTGKRRENRMGKGRKLRNSRKMGRKVLRNDSKRP